MNYYNSNLVCSKYILEHLLNVCREVLVKFNLERRLPCIRKKTGKNYILAFGYGVGINQKIENLGSDDL